MSARSDGFPRRGPASSLRAEPSLWISAARIAFPLTSLKKGRIAAPLPSDIDPGVSAIESGALVAGLEGAGIAARRFVDLSGHDGQLSRPTTI
jgi:hypothetical protein